MPESIVECVNVFRVFCQIKSQIRWLKNDLVKTGEIERGHRLLRRYPSMGSGRTCSSSRSSPLNLHLASVK